MSRRRRPIWDYYSTTSSGTVNEPTGGWDFGIDTNAWLYNTMPVIRRLTKAELIRTLGESPEAKVGSIRWI